ncbi:MAG: hypothetical protein U0840_16405 [Gemmataceae bacterium]
MNDSIPANGTTPYEEFVWRRLEEPFKFFGQELPPLVWVVVLGLVLAVALVYVVWMYIKDSHSIGPWWATLLGLLRTSVYAILAVIFLLPARQSYLETRTEAKVLVVFDTSASMHTSDALPSGSPNEKLPTRMDKVYEFLSRQGFDFLTGLEKKNPVTAYRLGARLDDAYLHFAGGRVWTKEEKENPPRNEDGVIQLPEARPLPEEYWRAWLNPTEVKPPEMGNLPDDEKKRLEKLDDLNKKARQDGLVRGTNLGDSLLGLINRELNNRLQGIVVFTDGRNNEGSPNAFRELEARARAARVPLFVVAVGEDRQKVKIEIADLRAPGQIQPEDKYRVKTEIIGEGLAGEKLDVTLEITHTRLVKTKVKDKEGKLVEQEKEELLPIELIEAEDQDNPKSTREKITLGDKLVLKPSSEVQLDKGTPPRAEVEWQLDAAALAAAGKIDLTDPRYRGRKWEIGESKDDTELRYVVKVPVDKREGLREKFHESSKVSTKVIKKPIRVLLVAAAANRDYQFVRSLLIREMEKKRLEMTIYLQLPPGELKRRPGIVQDVPPERLLSTFPDSFRKKKDLYDLSSYDVIIGFDPDWLQIQPDQVKMVKEWAEKGGGLVMIGGYINTVELIRPRDGEDAERFKPILDLLPVVLDDRRDYIDRKTDDPWALDFEGASPEMEFLKLDEELDESKFKEDWQAFFFGAGKERTEKPQRGFYSFYPVQRAKSGSIVIGRFTDPTARLKDNTMHPYLVTTPEALPRVIWLGSAETWRLREFREAYHERFWTKLVRYAAAKSKGAVIKTIRLEAPTQVVSGRYMEIEAKIDGPDGQPLDRNARPEITLKMPPGVPDTEIKQPILMTPRPGARDGWFSGRFLVRSPGEYEFTVKVPRTPGADSEQAETARFLVKEANPELDNTRPDHDRLYRMASEADEVLLRMSEEDRGRLRRSLVRPRLETGAERDDKTEIAENKQRLYFDLKNANLIPTCMVQDVQRQVSRGRHRDLWDDGFTLYEYPRSEDANKPTPKPVKISYVLLLVVGLLSTEWLIRKLLRLA